MPRIVIVGGGFAGAYCAQALERELAGLDAEVLLVDRKNYLVFHPLLIEAGTGSLEPRHAVVPIRSFLKRGRFRLAEVRGIDFDRREVRLSTPLGGGLSSDPPSIDVVPYDHLVLALGSVTRMPDGIPGLREHAFQLKDMADAIALRDRAIQMLELADTSADAELRRELLHFVIVGGNFTGVELAGEFHVFLREAARRYPNLDAREVQVTLVERSDRILNVLDADLSDYARREMERRGMRVLVNESATELFPYSVTLAGGGRLRTRTVVWCAGIAPSPLLPSLGLSADKLGWLVCDPDLRIQGRADVWGAGDCAVSRDVSGRPHPATAQHAIREGIHVARMLGRVLRGQPTEPFAYEDIGSLAALGCRTGVARVFGVKLSGFAAWFLWRGVYLMKMPGWGRRVRIALDWAMDLLFRRDYVQMGVHK